jgi:Xaa-Pro aminopeptidase
VVLSAEKKGVELSVPGSSLKTIHDEATRILTEGMVDLGILPGPLDDALSMHHYSVFFMHGTSHWLGLDVHDRGAYRIDGVSRPLESGMSFTVEPGIYVAAEKGEVELILLDHDLESWNQRRVRLGRAAAAKLETEEKEKAEKLTHELPEEFLGIGVRIEDNLLITADGHENMTESVPREIDDVESLCAEISSLPSAQTEAGRA